jgi:Domain of unknown function (DUF4386)
MSSRLADREASTGLSPGSSTRAVAIVAGALFIIADVATFAGDALLRTLVGSDYLTQLPVHATLTALGVFAKIVSALAGAGIAVAMYRVMKRANVGLALGSVVFRAVEAAFYLIGAMSLLVMLRVGQQFVAAGVTEQASLQALGDSFMTVRGYAAPMLGVFAFCLGSFLYNVLFFRSRLVPRWLSGFGIAAIICLTTACMLSLFTGNHITSYIPLAAPVFVQELVLAVWLIVRGFNTASIAGVIARQQVGLPHVEALSGARSAAGSAR